MFHPHRIARLLVYLALSGAAASLGAETKDTSLAGASTLSWHKDYGKAQTAAERQHKMLLIYFRAADASAACKKFDAESLVAPAVVEKLKRFVLVQVPTDAKIEIDGRPETLLAHPAFAEMLGRPGVAIVDYAHPKASYFRYVVSVFPLSSDRHPTAEQMTVILDLPPGTLTQRTLIYAVRTHPDRPASTQGTFDPTLAAEAESHSEYQARIRLQGHHFWERRFHRINACLPRGLMAREVCAESWPGQGLLESAVECVRCWRLSSGHWEGVAGSHRLYGYDMRRGANGVWYATGIFSGI